MKKMFIIISIIFINIYVIHSDDVPQHPELAKFTVLERECPACERIYYLRNKLNYLNVDRLDHLNSIAKWLKTQPDSVPKRNIQTYLKELRDYTDKLIVELAHDPKVIEYLENVQRLINKIDPLLPVALKLENQNFYEIMKEVWDIDNDLETQAVPGTYNHWLTKRIALVA
jgi:hypothetical protein